MPTTAIRPAVFTSVWPRSLDLHAWVLRLLLGWILLGCAAQLHLALRDSLVNSVDLLFDDAYYYLGVAWNVANGHGSRFTEPLPTNGYHPLWLMVLAVFTAVFDLSKQGLFCTALVLTALVKCLGIWLFDRGAADAWRQTCGRIAVFIAIVKFPFVFSLGMETTLFIVSIPWLLRIAAKHGWSRGDAVRVGCALSVVFLTRIDALALDAVVLLLALATRRASVRTAAIAALPLGLTVIAYALFNQVLFGTPLPVSGQAKAIGAHFAGNLGTTLDAFGSLRWSGAMLALWLAAKASVAPRLRIDGFQLLALGTAGIACGLYYGLMSGWPIWPWYLYPTASLSIYATVAGLSAAAAFVNAAATLAARRLDPRALRIGVAAVVAGVAALCLFSVVRDDSLVRGHLAAHYLRQDIRDPGTRSFNQQNVALIPWLEQRYPRGARLAMGDRAGGLGYWMPTRYTLIQTEGLVADKAFLQTLKSGSLESYLTAQHVELYVTDRPRALTLGPVMAFVEPVQPRLTEGPLNVLCFRGGDALLNQDYMSANEPQVRRVFALQQRVACPAPLIAELRTLQTRYDGIRSGSGF